MIESSITLSEITVIDHAYINNEGKIIGGSFHASFVVTGKVDATESVVVDFSTIKKDIKENIDSAIDGFDHKLWMINGWSLIENGAATMLESFEHDITKIYTPSTVLEVPSNAVKVIEELPILEADYTEFYLEEAMGCFLVDKLSKKYPNINIDVQVVLTKNATIFDVRDFKHIEPVYFRYSHGLKNSTSWGCQNIAHGHLSFATVYYNEDVVQATPIATFDSLSMLLTEIRQYLDDVVFIAESNITNRTATTVTVNYRTPRGTFTCVYDTTVYTIIVLPIETTIEYIVEHVKDLFGALLKQAGASKLLVSEGLSKGALVEL